MYQINQKFFCVTVYIIISLSAPSLMAASEFSSRILLKEQLVSNKTALLDESGQITTISPGFNYTNIERRSKLTLDYAYNINLYNGLSNDDSEYNSLSLLYGFEHIPQHWTTQLTGNIQQSTINSDGIQSFNPDLNSDSTKELRTYGVSSAFNTNIKREYNLDTRVLANVADYEDSDTTDSIGFDISLDNKVSQNKFFWSTSVSNRQTNSGNSDSEKLVTYQLGLNYRFNAKYTAYISSTANDTSNTQLNKTSTLAGLNWQPNKNSHINIAAGTRGGDTTYSLNSRFIKKRLSLSINYNESITSARNEAVQEISDESGFTSTFQSLDITPVLQKKAAINFTLSGKRSEGTVSYSSQRRTKNDGTDDENVDALSLLLSRKLSLKSTISFKYQLQNSVNVEKNDITNLQLTYNRVLSKNINMTAWLSSAEQKSDLLVNEYDQKIIGVSVVAAF